MGLKICILLMALVLLGSVSATRCTTLALADCVGDAACIWDNVENRCATKDCKASYETPEDCSADSSCNWDSFNGFCASSRIWRGVWGKVEQVSHYALVAVSLVLGRPDRVEAERQGVIIPDSAFAQLLIFYIIPIAVLSELFNNIFVMFGFFRQKTSRVIGIVLALMGARTGIYVSVVNAIGSKLGGFVGGAVGIIIILAMLGYAVSHVMLGYKHAKALMKMQGGQEYLSKIGEHVEALSKGEK